MGSKESEAWLIRPITHYRDWATTYMGDFFDWIQGRMFGFAFRHPKTRTVYTVIKTTLDMLEVLD